MPAIICEMLVQVPREAIEIAGTSINSVLANSDTPNVPFLAKVMSKFFVNFGMTLLKIRHKEKTA